MIFFTIFYNFIIHFDTWIFWHQSSDVGKASYGQARHERNEKPIGIQSQKSHLWVHSGMCGSLMADKASENVGKAPKSTPLIPLPSHFPAHSLQRVTDFMEAGDWTASLPEVWDHIGL